MSEVKTKLVDDGKIAIPSEYRQALGLHIGDDVILRLENGEIRILTSTQAAIRYVQELLRPYLPEGRSLSDELIAERRLESLNE